MKRNCIRNAVKDLWRVRKGSFPASFGGALVNAIKPYIYLLFPAWILDELMGQKRTEQIILLVCIAVILNGLLLWVQQWLENVNMDHSDACSMLEKKMITEKLLEVDFNVLDEGEYAKYVAQHRSESAAMGGVLRRIKIWIAGMCRAFVQLALALWMLREYWKILISKTSSDNDALWLGMLILGLTVFSVVCLTWVKGRMNRKSRKAKEEYYEISGTYEYYKDEISRYQTGKEVRIFHMQPVIMRKAKEKLVIEGRKLLDKIARYEALGEGIGDILFELVLFGCYIFVGLRTVEGALSIGGFVIVTGAIKELLMGLQKTVVLVSNLEDIRPQAELYDRIMHEQEKAKYTGGKSIENMDALELRDVSFSYENSESKVLQKIDLSIHAGEKIALVGRNGSGKTTLIKLICGLYQPDSGEILMNGCNVKEYDKEKLQNLFSVVFQDFTIFSLPLGENVAVSEEYAAEKVQKALESVGFTDKYDLNTVLFQDCYPDGVELSGGEKQKVALARALYKKSELVILDEPTSAMDPYAEMELYTKFNEIIGNKAAIFISHRLSSCRFCDRILVLDEGRIVQSGTHEQLVADHEGLYYNMWNAQAKYFTYESWR